MSKNDCTGWCYLSIINISQGKPKKPRVMRGHRLSHQAKKQWLLDNPNTVKDGDGNLHGDAHTVFCRCHPGCAIKLDPCRAYDLKNWNSHAKVCELLVGSQVQGWRCGESKKGKVAGDDQQVCDIPEHICTWHFSKLNCFQGEIALTPSVLFQEN